MQKYLKIKDKIFEFIPNIRDCEQCELHPKIDKEFGCSESYQYIFSDTRKVIPCGLVCGFFCDKGDEITDKRKKLEIILTKDFIEIESLELTNTIITENDNVYEFKYYGHDKFVMVEQKTKEKVRMKIRTIKAISDTEFEQNKKIYKTEEKLIKVIRGY